MINLAISVKVKLTEGDAVRIGELSKRTGVPSRMLRYYEEQGLITPTRLPNGYREYDEYLIDRVGKIRGLIDAGIPTRIVTSILPCLGRPQTIIVENAEPGLFELLVTERDRMSEKIEFLEHNRDAMTRYLQALELADSRSPEATAS